MPLHASKLCSCINLGVVPVLFTIVHIVHIVYFCAFTFMQTRSVLYSVSMVARCFWCEMAIPFIEFLLPRYRDEASALRRQQLEWQARAPDSKRLVEAAVAQERRVQVHRGEVEEVTLQRCALHNTPTNELGLARCSSQNLAQ